MRILLQLIIALLLLVSVVGLFAVDYGAGIFLLIGVGIAILLAVILLGIRRYRRLMIPIALVLAVIVGVAWAALSSPVFVPLSSSEIAEGSISAQDAPAATAEVTRYRAFVEPIPGSQGSFSVSEEIVFDATLGDGTVLREQLQSFSARTIEAEPSGFMLQQVTIEPIAGASLTSQITVESAAAGQAVTIVCPGGDCPLASVELLDFPRGSFVDAQRAENISRSDFLDTQTITFDTSSLRSGIVIAYVPAPYNSFSMVLRPLLGATTFADWVFAFVGVLGSFILFPLIASFLENYLEGKLFGGVKWLAKRRKRG